MFESSRRIYVLGILATLYLWHAGAFARTADEDRCLLDALDKARPGTTVEELRAACTPTPHAATGPALAPDAGAVAQSMIGSRASDAHGAPILAYRPNYATYTYNDHPNEDPFAGILTDNESLDREEIKYQVSFKAPIAEQPFDTDGDVFFGYTSQSWWQIGDSKLSNPFRETDYEPEIFFRHYGGPEFLGLKVAGWDAGINHQSNGGSDPLSRSWNRLIAGVTLDSGDFGIALRAWYRLPEKENDDDNPDMYRYYGTGDLRLVYAPNHNTFSVLLRQGTQHGAVDATWSYPVSKFVRVYGEYFNGWGESLLDYNVHNERFGIGLAVNDWLAR